MENSIHSKLDKLVDKVDSVKDEQSRMNITLAKQEINIEQHIRRTELIENDLVPIKRHVQIVQGLLQAVGFISVLVSIVLGASKLLGLI